MRQYYWENAAILSLGVAVALVGALSSETGHILKHGTGIAFGALFAIKGLSKAKCRLSDLLFTAFALILFISSKAFSQEKAVSMAFEIAACVVLATYLGTGLTYKAMIAEEKKSDNQS